MLTILLLFGCPRLTLAAGDPRYRMNICPNPFKPGFAHLPQRPGVVDIYAVIVGGDAGDDVLRKETIAVHAALDNRLGTRGAREFFSTMAPCLLLRPVSTARQRGYRPSA
jgi:hypothetical protein